MSRTAPIERLDVKQQIIRAGRHSRNVAVARHIRAVDLQQEARLVDGIVLGLHRFRQREQVLLMSRVVAVFNEARDDAG